MLTACSLNGGNVLEKFVDTFLEWSSELDVLKDEINRDDLKRKMWQRLIELGQQFSEKSLEADHKRLICKATLFGERHDKTTFASFHHIYPGNISLGEIFTSLCAGIVSNLNEMFPSDLLSGDLGCRRMIATGGAILRNPILKQQLEQEFRKIPIVYKETSDANLGAAYFLRDTYLNKNTK